MARHASPKNLTGRRALAALATAGVALGVGAGSASAAADAPLPVGSLDAASGVRGTLGALPYVTGAVSALKPNPLAGTGVDPLDNGVGTQLADFQPLTSQALTGPVAQAQSVGTLPLVGDVAKALG
ncbi:hypothetical protein ACFW2X_10095 [Streptomyces antibioticus]|uniref:hypothetical protein n=1 Tax=Streptomyces antibioticus TaxID=1890 RepID=UPI003683B834